MTKATRYLTAATSVCFVLLLAAAAPAAVITQPSDLNPGDQYRLVFASSASRDALSSNIADYNTFVTNLALAVPQLNALGTTWTAIASTADVDARDNTGTNGVGVPIYRLDDVRVANDDADLWDDTLLQPISIGEDGNFAFGVIWTGTQGDGTEFGGATLGTAEPRNGVSASSDINWISSGTLTGDIEIKVYGISGVLTATATAVPEPATWVLGLVALAGAAGWNCRRVGVQA